MIILAIETTSSAASVALIDEYKLIGEYTSNAKLTHLQKLMPMIDHLLKNCDQSIDDVNMIAVSEGPGSFTGIRIGVSAAKALAQVKDIPIVSVPTLKALAYNIPCYPGVICPILDARRQQVYTCVYQWEYDDFKEIIEPGAYEIEELTEKLKDYKDIMFIGDGIVPYKESIIHQLGDVAHFAPQYLKMQRASSVAQLGYKMYQKGWTLNCYEAKPNYFRKSEAERNLEKQRGI